MKAIEVKKHLDKNICNVANAIAFYYGEKYGGHILETIDELSYYVYDNDDYQIGRLKNVELVSIAKQFAFDISDNLQISKEGKDKVNNELAQIIVDASSLENPRKYVEEKLATIKEFKDNYLDYVDEFLKVLNYFNRDYEVKKLTDKIDNSHLKKNQFDMEIIKIKRKILSDTFHIKNNDPETISYLWALLECFNPNLENIEFYKTYLNEQKKKFYKIIGCQGNDFNELMLEAAFKGIRVTDDLYFRCVSEYLNQFDELVKQYYLRDSNLEDIFNDLDRKGYYVDEKSISTFLIQTDNLCGVNFACIDEFQKETSFIIYNNNEALYAKDFNETFIHEIIHYIGGANPNIYKKGLHYNNDLRYLNLEEAYTNYVSKEITKLYQEKYPDLITSKDERKVISTYDCTLPYMKKVFELYQDELFRIHMSNNIDERSACAIMPYSQIADAVTRIKEAGILTKAVINEELNKLTRGYRR